MDPTLTIRQLRAHVETRARDAICALTGSDEDLALTVELQAPPDPTMGELGFPCFALAKTLRKAPPLIAAQVAAAITPDAIIERATADKAYVNITLKRAHFIAAVLGDALNQERSFGSNQVALPAHWMVEYSSPNTNKPLHLGHLRNNMLGSSIAEMVRFIGHRVTRVNLVNDRGVHICKSMLAYQLDGSESDPKRAGKKGDHFVGEFYVAFDRCFVAEYKAWQSTDAAQARFDAWREKPAGRAACELAAKESPPTDPRAMFFGEYKDDYFNNESPLGAQVRDMLVKWEAGDSAVVELWRRMNGWVLGGFEESYRRMGVGFDRVQYESETYTLGKELVSEGLKKGVLSKRKDGAVVCDLAQVGLEGEKVLLRSDGTSVYMTQDLGTAVERFDRFTLDRLIYVVGDEQIFHFDVLFRVLGLIRPGLTERCHHLAYGMIRLPEGKMKSREGTVVDADDLMDEMHALARKETEARTAEGKAHTENIDEAELEKRAERVGMAALKYFLLKFSPRKSFEYDPRASIDFLGNTGPYSLFNYARTQSLLRRAGGRRSTQPSDAVVACLTTDRELEIVRHLFEWPAVVLHAAQALDPSRITEYVFELCKKFAFVFTDKANHPIATCDDEMLKEARLLLTAAVGSTIRTAFGILGIDLLEEM